MGFEAVSFDAFNKQQAAAKDAAAKKAAADALAKQQAGDAAYAAHPNIQTFDPSSFEQQAGVTPPSFEGLRDVRTGKLLSDYTINPFAGEASQRIRSEALGSGPTSWAQQQLTAQGLEESKARGAAGLQQQQAQGQAQSELARFGGIGSGARTSLARSGARDLLAARQNVGMGGAQARAGIGANDAQLKQQLLGTTADVERQGDLTNLNTNMQDMSAKAQFGANRYNQQMSAWAAKQSADATRAAAAAQNRGGKK